jgi:hypothetical protein
MSLNSREFLIRKERDRVVGRLGQLASIFKVRLGLGEIEGRDRETERQRNRADNKNPEQSWVAQLVATVDAA